MPLSTPDRHDDMPVLLSAEKQPEASFAQTLRGNLVSGSHAIVSRLELTDIEHKLRETKRFYLDLDNSLLTAGTTSFDDYTLRMLGLIIDNGGEVTFLTGKPQDEVTALVASMPEELQEKVSILYEKGAYRYTKENPAEYLLSSEGVEREMQALGEECFESWKPLILARHGVVISRAGTGTHTSVLSIDLERPGAVLAPNDPERMSVKIDPKDAKVSEVIATINELIAASPRPLDLRVTNLGNANLEIEVMDIEKGSAIARLEHDKTAERDGRALVMDDSGNGETMFTAGRFLPHVTNALVYHDTTPEQMLPLADIAVAGKAKGAHILEKVAQAKGNTHDLTVVSNTPSLDRTPDNEFTRRMGAPVAIGGVVRATRRALWIYPKQQRPDGTVDDFSDYPDEMLKGKFVPVGIDGDEYNSQYNRISNTNWWFWTHPDTFGEIEREDPVHMERYLRVSQKMADKLAERVPNGDTRYVSTHDFQVMPVAKLFRQSYPEKKNVRFHIFWHVPIPSREQALRLPADELAERLRWFMAYDQIGVHTEEYKRNLLDIFAMFADRGIKAPNIIVQPISIDVDAMREHAIEVANAPDFRFRNPEFNNFFQLDVPLEKRDELIMAPPERADPIKGGFDRLEALVEMAERDPRQFDGKRFVEFIIATRLDSKVYKDNYEGMLRLQARFNKAVGRQAIFNAGKLDDRREVAGAMHLASKAMFTSRDDGFNMTIPETLVTWGASRLINPRIRRMIATSRTGFVLSLKEHGLLEPGKEALPVMPSAARNKDGFRKGIQNLLGDKVAQPRYDILEMYLSRYTLQKWIDANVRTHVRSSFRHGVEIATGA